MYYGPDIMKSAGITVAGLDDTESSLVLNIPLSAFNATGTILSIFFIDKLGRRFIILRSLPFIAVSWLITAAGMAFTGENQPESTQTTGGIIACIGVSLFLLCFSFGMSSTPWTINAEIYPLHVIGTANSLSATTNWVVNAFVSECFKLLTEISIASEVIVYVCLGGFAVICFFFTDYLIPETANKPIDQILVDILGPDYQAKENERINRQRSDSD